jgi:hypothetical protein
MPDTSTDAAEPLIPELEPDEDVWVTVAVPSLTLLATDRRLLSRRGSRTESWDYGDIVQVVSAGVDGDVVISFTDGHRPLVIHAKDDDDALQGLTVIGLLVAKVQRSNGTSSLAG